MIRDLKSADDAIADMVWWLKGFAAARPASIDEGPGEHRELERKLGEVRALLSKIGRAKVRRLGEETAVVLSFPEFERLVDAVRVPRLGETAMAIQTIEKVLAEYRAEDEAARRGDDIPF